MHKADFIGITKFVTMVVYFSRKNRAWWGYYVDGAGNQLGDAWHSDTRDSVLVHRPPTPEVPQN